MTPIFNSCGLTERLNKASTTQGRIAAGINLPAAPEELRKQEPHAPLVAGAELRSILVNERAALNRANARISRWGAFWDDTKTNFEKGQ